MKKLKIANHNKTHDEVVARLRKKLEDAGSLTLHLKSFIGRRIGGKFIPIVLPIGKGWPDVLCFRPDGVVELFEVKTGTGRIEPEQRKKFDELVRRGFRVTIIRGPLMAREDYRWKKIEN
jgi:hypothetical protein